MLLDDHALFRESLSQLLDTEPDFRMVAHCGASEEALDALSREVVDLVLLDYDLGEETGIQFIRRAREAGYKGRIFIVTAGMADSDSVRALGQGVCGIFLKHSPPALLSEAIRKAMAGETWIDQRCIRALVQAVEKTGEPEGRTQRAGGSGRYSKASSRASPTRRSPSGWTFPRLP